MAHKAPPQDTIVALASPAGVSPRAIIRISGPATSDLLLAFTDPAPIGRIAQATTFKLSFPAENPDEARRVSHASSRTFPILALRFMASSSYTGEESAELLIPGNPVLAERVLSQLTTRHDVRFARPGEFTARAYLNNRLTLEEAEAVATTIAARTRSDLEATRALVSGSLARAYHELADELTNLLAYVEAGIDFTDQEDVVAILPSQLASGLARLRSRLTAVLGCPRDPARDRALPLVALVGPPSAGKSTLFNALLGRQRALTHESPGTTRDVLQEELDLSAVSPGSARVLLADLPGLESDPTTEPGRASQHAAHAAITRADVILHCDPGARFHAPPAVSPQTPIIRVQTKADLPGVAEPHARTDLAVCALDRWNLPRLARAIADASARSSASESLALLPRHARALLATKHAIEDALGSFDQGAPRLDDPEITAAALRAALEAVGELTGKIHPDDVIGRVFATFCVGK